MRIRLKVVSDATSKASARSTDVQRVPVLGEHVRDGGNWYQVKRVCHVVDAAGAETEVFVVPVSDPTRDAPRFFEWLEAGSPG